MPALIIALLPIIKLALAGGGIAALGGVSAGTWLSLGLAALKAAPEEIQAVRGLHGIFDHVIGQVFASGSAMIASEAAKSWLAENGAKAIEFEQSRDTEA